MQKEKEIIFVSVLQNKVDFCIYKIKSKLPEFLKGLGFCALFIKKLILPLIEQGLLTNTRIYDII